jgi:hypothetical protein
MISNMARAPGRGDCARDSQIKLGSRVAISRAWPDLDEVGTIGEAERDLLADHLALLKELPRNERATELYRAHFLASHSGADPEQMPHMPVRARRAV